MKVFVLYNFPNHLRIKMVCIIREKKRQKKNFFVFVIDFTVSPSVWLGTSTGCVIVINLNITYEPRNISGKYLFIQLLIKRDLYSKFSVVPSGSVFRLCGRLLHISFLDHKGAIILPPSEKWDTKSKETFFFY